MENQLVEKNLAAIQSAVQNHTELLVENGSQSALGVVSAEEYNNCNDQARKDQTKFVISKTIAFSPAVFEGNVAVRDSIYSIMNELVTYFNNRGMAPIAELMADLVKNERMRDSLHEDYSQKKKHG